MARKRESDEGESLSLVIIKGVIPKSPRFYQRAEGSPVAHSVVAEILRSA